jgi:hypothetical protein
MAAFSKPKDAFLKKFICFTTINMPIISMCAMANCRITRPLLIEMPPTIFADSLLFKAVIGLKRDKIMAGYKPDKRVTAMNTAIENNMRDGLAIKLKDISTSSSLFKNGKTTNAIPMAAINATIVINAVSLKNWNAS